MSDLYHVSFKVRTPAIMTSQMLIQWVLTALYWMTGQTDDIHYVENSIEVTPIPPKENVVALRKA